MKQSGKRECEKLTDAFGDLAPQEENIEQNERERRCAIERRE